MPPKRKKPNKKEIRFIAEYTKKFDGAGAYRIAFPDAKPEFAKQYAYKLLHKPYMQEAIDEAIKEALGPMEKDLTQNVQFWIQMRDDPEEKAANRLKASEYLAKYRGLFTEKHEHSGEVAVNIVDDI